jgi:hypothetical protein
LPVSLVSHTPVKINAAVILSEIDFVLSIALGRVNSSNQKEGGAILSRH